MMFKEIEIAKIKFNKNQPRKQITEIAKLAKNIKINGQLQPIRVIKQNDFYELVSGERRTKAMIVLGMKTIKAEIIDKPSEFEMLAENICRKDLNVLEKALAIDKIFSTKHGKNYAKLLQGVEQKDTTTIEKEEQSILESCSAIGLSPTYIYQILHVLNLSDNVQKSILEREENIGAIIMLNLARIKDPERQKTIFESIIDNNMSTKQAMQTISTENAISQNFLGRKIQIAIYHLTICNSNVQQITAKKIQNQLSPDQKKRLLIKFDELKYEVEKICK